MLPAQRRIPQVRALIDQQTYFVVHAPRQVGKSTALMSLGDELTREGRYTALLVSLEYGRPFRGDPGAAELAELGPWHRDAHASLPIVLRPPPWPDALPGERINAWVLASPRPHRVENGECQDSCRL